MMFRWRNVLTTATKSHHSVVDQKISIVRKMASDAADLGNKFKLPKRYGTGEKTVWVEYNNFIQQHKPKINLGQGFFDGNPPDYVIQALKDAANDPSPSMHQYTRAFGNPRLVNALSDLYSPLINRKIDPMNEIILSTGATGILFYAIMGHVSEGDEIIIIEPFFDVYDNMAKISGGTPRYIPLIPKAGSDEQTSNDWKLDFNELEKMFNHKTKMIIVNSPLNPLGKIWTKEELTVIADLCKKFNVLCLYDEVYEFMVFPPNKHVRMATLDGMWERTISIGSAGKVYSATGWKTGWAYGPANLLRNLQIVHQSCIYCHVTLMQEATARAIEFDLAHKGTPESYIHSIAEEIIPKRDFLVDVLRRNGFTPVVPDGGYFIMADWTKLKNKIDLSSEKDTYDDYKFTKKYMKESSVVAIPSTAFYSQSHKENYQNYIRFCFMKEDETLKAAAKLMDDWTEAHK